MKLTVDPQQAEAARSLAPLSERPTLQGVEYLYRDPDRQKVAALGKTSVPHLSELFVAIVGGGR